MTRNPSWWAVARSEEVTRSKPFSVAIGDEAIVLWRDQQGIARALEDRCPHRRAPLSLGCIRDNGWIQCGYHGWSYDGASGRTTEIPNLKQAQKLPALYRAMTYVVHESGGLVRVCRDNDTTAPTATDLARMPLSGTVHVGLSHEQYVAALFDDPSLLITIRGLRFTPYLISELREQNGRLTMERSCQWRWLHWPAAFSSEFPLSLFSATHPHTGETQLTIRDADFNEYLHAVLAPVPTARGVTAVRWRAGTQSGRKGLYGLSFAMGDPFTVHANIDAAGLRVLKPSVSLHGAQLRAQLLTRSASVSA